MWSFLLFTTIVALFTARFPGHGNRGPHAFLKHKNVETPKMMEDKQLDTYEDAEARLEAAEAKIIQLEEELRVVGNNMMALEISEQEALLREDSYEATIRDLTQRLTDAEYRAAEAERVVIMLQKEIVLLEDELLCDNLDHTLDELAEM